MLVRKSDGKWQRFDGDAEFTSEANTRQEIYADGRVIDNVPCDPYPVKVRLSARGIEKALASGAWKADDLARYGLAVPEAFVPPKGRRKTGAVRYVESGGKVREEYDTETLPAPTVQTLDDKLAAIGLSRAELKQALAE